MPESVKCSQKRNPAFTPHPTQGCYPAPPALLPRPPVLPCPMIPFPLPPPMPPPAPLPPPPTHLPLRPPPPCGPPPSHVHSLIFPGTAKKFALTMRKKFIDVNKRYWTHVQLAKEGMMACLFCVGQRLLYGKLKISGRPMLVEVDEKCIARVPVVWVEEGPPIHEGWFTKIIENNYYAPGEFAITLDQIQTRKLDHLLKSSFMMAKSASIQLQSPSTLPPGKPDVVHHRRTEFANSTEASQAVFKSPSSQNTSNQSPSWSPISTPSFSPASPMPGI